MGFDTIEINLVTNVCKSLRWNLKLTLCENLPGNYWSRTQIGQITHPLALLIKDDDNKSNFSDFCQAQLHVSSEHLLLLHIKIHHLTFKQFAKLNSNFNFN